MSREAEHRSATPTAGPEVRHVAEGQRLDHEADLSQTGGDQLLAALIGRSDGTAGEKIPSQVNGLRHQLQLPRSVRGYTAGASAGQALPLVTPL